MPIRVIVTGATGMIGQGALRACLRSPEVASVLVLNRTSTDMNHAKLQELIRPDIGDLATVRSDLTGYQACFFCAGVSALGMSEADYTRLTYDMTTSVAATLHELNPGMTFVYVSGMGTDSSERGRQMWARVKGRTENAILDMGFGDAYAFRPGMVLPEDGIQSRTRWYNVLYTLMRPFYSVFRKFNFATTTSRVGQALIWLATRADNRKHIENSDINRLADQATV